jgi:hypothetical protein
VVLTAGDVGERDAIVARLDEWDHSVRVESTESRACSKRLNPTALGGETCGSCAHLPRATRRWAP